jgi:hypothetical protein
MTLMAVMRARLSLDTGTLKHWHGRAAMDRTATD